MRFLVRMHFPVDFGNELVRDPNFPKKLEGVLNAIKPEAVYFTPLDGERGMYIVVDLAGADMIAGITEPLWQEFRCKLELTPVMVLDDLKKALQNLKK
jgi:hypothetical protein